MKLIIQIPCYNEEGTLLETLRDLPLSLPGIKEIEILLIDDGSSDQSVRIAEEFGVKHILRFPRNRGLAHAFSSGISYALEQGADIIVNTDADHQYKGVNIQALVAPILNGNADIAIGNRQVGELGHFSFLKKILQKAGSWFVRQLSHTNVPDAVSGFRAYSRNAALRMNILSEYSYTTETLIQAGRNRMNIATVPIEVNQTFRPSRLVRSIPSYVRRMSITIIRAYTMYQPLKVFTYIGLLLLSVGGFLFLRFLFFVFILGNSTGHIQSLIIGAVFFIMGFQTILIGLLSDVVAANRKLIEEVLLKLRTIEIRFKDR
jgi:glycosyltransferase involved in cell wall biosynthesis